MKKVGKTSKGQKFNLNDKCEMNYVNQNHKVETGEQKVITSCDNTTQDNANLVKPKMA